MWRFNILKDLEESKRLSKRLKVDDRVEFRGSRPNGEILEEMQRHEIFLFTSDRYEGWGAVANESMSNGCVLVGSDAIGSVPYLISDESIGMIFKSGDVDSLTSSVRWLLQHPDERRAMRERSVQQLKEVWSPSNAAKQFLELVEDLNKKRGLFCDEQSM